MNNRELLTPIAAFYQHAKAHPKRVVFRQPINGDLIEYSFADALFEIECMASRLLQLPPKSKIGIISLNCAHWVMADLAIMLAGHISIPIYPTASTATVAQILEHSGCRLIFVGKMPDWEAKNYLIPGIIQTISMHHEHQGMESWSGITGRYSVAESYPDIDLDEMSSIIYTSGTTGLPKGVMTSFRSMAESGVLVSDWVELNADDRFFSYLPLAHAAERVAVEMGAIYCGGVISFVGSMDTFNDDLVSSKATIFLGVPRIWIKFQQAIEAKIPPSLLKILLNTPLLNKIVKNKLLKRLGLSNIKLALSGAAALPLDTLKWFENLGLPICEAYGMTESFGISNFNHPEHRRPGSVGILLPGCEMKIAEDGEILYKNTCLMMGYYLEPELTDQMMSDGFLHTGDTGTIDKDGYLWITGRVKDIFKTSKGKYISPIKIEMELEPRASLDQICVMGSNLTQPVVLGAIAVKPEKSDLDNFEAKLERILNELNKRLEKSEKIKNWFLVEEVWSTDNEMITPTLKMKRQVIEKKYMPQIEQSLSSDKTIIWLKA
jgi:long-chain acyl-CoA synthetase